MKVKLKGWRKEREVFLTFRSKLVLNGGAVNLADMLPKEYDGCEVLITVIPKEDEVLKEILRRMEG
jgi:putative transposon-encoded protein